MALLLASLALAFAGVMSMVAAAVVAYFLWSGALWWFENKAAGSGFAGISRSFDTEFLGAGGSRLLDAGSFSSVHEVGSMSAAAHLHRARGIPADIFRPSGGQGVVRPYSVVEVDSPSPRPSGQRHGRGGWAASAREVSLSPSSPARGSVTRQEPDMSPDAVKMRSPRARPAGPEELLRGYAAQLSLKFGGDLQFHLGNVSAVIDAFSLTPADICYCFLCLEEGSKAAAGLALKKWGTGTFAARVWVVSLARFVKAAQRQRNAHDEKLLEVLCSEWQYIQDHFAREVQACEAPFQRQHGKALLTAFQHEDTRKTEVLRARKILAEHGAAAAPAVAPKGSTPALANLPAWAGDLPPLPLANLPAWARDLPPLSAPSEPAALENGEVGAATATAAISRKRNSASNASATEVVVPRKRGRQTQ
eukprot:TRINITY_DN61941_c0_g1_i1.p1 TRINITY_DN61941_c0_g1~~TRINITY_DN61941_c0_g1_i1.p1  ORF type:complete len:420 (-),score=91.53 TRINITY_DN61941_c0_g1_i1:20-1279(-)